MATLPDLLNQLTRQREELDTLRPLTSEQVGRIDQHFRLLLNYHSNRLEGNSLDFGESKMVILHGMTADGKPLRDHFEIIGHNEALKWLGNLIKAKEPLTERFIRELHLTILKERFRKKIRTEDGEIGYVWVEVGQYKEKPNHVETSTGEMFFFASVEDTPIKMRELVNWYNEEVKKSDLHPLVLAAELHYRFVRIHPFDDGNGRVARLLMSFVLLRFGYSHLVVRTDAKRDYLTALEAYDDGRKEEFYTFLAEALRDSMDLMLKGARGEPMEEEEDWRKRLAVIQHSMAEDEVPIEKKNAELLKQRYSDTFYPLYRQLKKSLSGFDEVYAATNHVTDYLLLQNYFEREKLARENGQTTGFKPINWAAITRIDFQLRWEALKNSGTELYGNGVSVSFECSDKYTYQVASSVTRKPFIKKRYTEAMTVAERKDFVNAVASQLVQLLDNQLLEIKKKADEK